MIFKYGILALAALACFQFGSGQSWTKAGNWGESCTPVDQPCNGTLHLECIEGFCACEENYSSDRNRDCKKSYGQTCTYVLDCNIDRYLGCDTDNLCTCQRPSQQIFDGERLSCVSLIGFGCDHSPGEFALSCVPNAFCDMPIINGSMVHRCTCNEGYEPTEDRICLPSIY